MEKLITPEAVASEVKMTRAGTKNAIVLLEGEDDIAVYKKFFKTGSVEIVAAYGKRNAVVAVNILNCEEQVQGILAIVDSDYDQIDGHDTVDNVLRTDYHDMETGIFLSSAFMRIIDEYCTSKVDRLGCGRRGLADHLMNQILPLSYLRYLSARRRLELDFNGLDYRRFVDGARLMTDAKRLVRTVIQNTLKSIDEKISAAGDPGIIMGLRDRKRRIPTDASVLTSLDAMTKTGTTNLPQLTNGHDLITVFGLALCKCVGSVDRAVSSPDNLSRVFRLAYSLEDFRDTTLHASLNCWQVKMLLAGSIRQAILN